MHITVSFKDHSSICTCMLIKREKKNPEWLNRNKDITTNKQPVNERGGGGVSDKKTASTSDLNVSRGVKKKKKKLLKLPSSPLYAKCVCTAEAFTPSTWQCHRRATFSHKANSDARAERQRSRWPLSTETVLLLSPWGVCLKLLSDLPTLDILKYHISAGKDANLAHMLTIKATLFNVWCTVCNTYRGHGGLWIQGKQEYLINGNSRQKTKHKICEHVGEDAMIGSNRLWQDCYHVLLWSRRYKINTKKCDNDWGIMWFKDKNYFFLKMTQYYPGGGIVTVSQRS